MNEISIYSNELKELCDIYKVNSLYAFGSVNTSQFNTNSDIDFVVDISDTDPISYSDKYFNLKLQLEKLFNRRIDLLEQKALRNPFLKARIDNTKVLIYGE